MAELTLGMAEATDVCVLCKSSIPHLSNGCGRSQHKGRPNRAVLLTELSYVRTTTILRFVTYYSGQVAMFLYIFLTHSVAQGLALRWRGCVLAGTSPTVFLQTHTLSSNYVSLSVHLYRPEKQLYRLLLENKNCSMFCHWKISTDSFLLFTCACCCMHLLLFGHS